jgi:glycosyltransferase involved in cell wall biosynthesis
MIVPGGEKVGKFRQDGLFFLGLLAENPNGSFKIVDLTREGKSLVDNREKKTLVIVPTLNEKEGIGELVRTIKTIGFPIVVINDGSSDTTVYEAAMAGAVVLSHAFNLGYGASLQTGYKYALSHGFDFLVQLDGDGQHDPADIPTLLAAVTQKTTDLAIGSRFLGSCDYSIPASRKFGIRFFSIVLSAIMKRRITDPTSGFQAMTAAVIALYCNDLFPHDYPDLVVIIRVWKQGFRIKEIPVHMRARKSGVSMHQRVSDNLYYLSKVFLSFLFELMATNT